MATIKVACPKCGQKVSGDESFHGTTVECPVCSADIRFPGEKRGNASGSPIIPVPPDPGPQARAETRPAADHDSKPDAVLPRAADEPGTNPAPPPSPALPGNAAPAVKLEAGTETPGTSAAPPSADGDEEDEIDDLPPSPIWGAISIVSAVLSIVTCVGGILFAPIAIICGHTALAKARHSPVQPAPGHTLGAIGLMIGYVSLVLLIITLFLTLIFQETLREFIQGIRD
jgi:DNA-directed RNA polymerase subunit RPC12/RpoP